MLFNTNKQSLLFTGTAAAHAGFSVLFFFALVESAYYTILLIQRNQVRLL